jgi:hypothetical protein
MDTADDLLRKLPNEELERLMVKFVGRILERKLLRAHRVGDYYLVGVDATGVMRAKEDDEGTLAKESKTGKISYTREVLEAKIIVPGGFAISIASEWLASDLNDNGTKEDCELNAFKRLAKKIKKLYPKLRLCILADSLYPSDPFFEICKENGWRFCAMLKDGKLATVWKQVDASLNKAEADGQVENMILDGKVTIEWVTDIVYRLQHLGWIDCHEYSVKTKQETHFAFVTDLPLDHDTARQIVAAGRSRWRIEDAFNTQKNRGYTLSHKYSRKSFVATKNYYLLMQIGHMINQLVEYSQHLARLFDHTKETIKHLWGLIVSALTFIDDDTVWTTPAKRVQYRFSFG